MMFTRQDINNSRLNNPSLNNKPAETYQPRDQRLVKVKVTKSWSPKATFFRARVARFSGDWFKNKIKTNTVVFPLLYPTAGIEQTPLNRFADALAFERLFCVKRGLPKA